MALCSKLQVKLPDKGIIIKKGNKYPYVYHVDSYYRNEKGVPTHKKRSIGKFDARTGMLIPNQTYYEIYENQNEIVFREQAEISYGEVKEIGLITVISEIFDTLGITKILMEIVGKTRFQMIQIVAAYMLLEGNVMQYIDDFCDNNLFDKSITDREVSKLFAQLTNAERMSFFKEWVKLHIQNEYIAYDVTSFSTYAKNIDDAEFGYNS